jgi:hypothetical protein
MVADRVSSYVREHFPVTAGAFASSLAHELLQRFWSYLFFIRRSFPADIPHSLEAYRKSVELAPSALQAISTMLHSNVCLDSSVQNGARRKGMRGRRATVTIDTEPFNKLGIVTPSTVEAAEHCALSILQDQRHILEVISVLTLPLLP